MSLTTKGTKRIANGLATYAKAGNRIAAQAPIKACEAFFSSPPPDRPGDRAWATALELIRHDEAFNEVDNAHGHAMADLGEEAFLTGFFAGMAYVKVGAR